MVIPGKKFCVVSTAELNWSCYACTTGFAVDSCEIQVHVYIVNIMLMDTKIKQITDTVIPDFFSPLPLILPPIKQ